MLKECRYFIEAEGNFLVWLMSQSVLMIYGCCGVGIQENGNVVLISSADVFFHEIELSGN